MYFEVALSKKNVVHRSVRMGWVARPLSALPDHSPSLPLSL